MTKFVSKQNRVLLLTMIALFTLLFSIPFASAQPADIQGHWAEKQISGWFDRGLAKGYADGTFKPDGTITRAEFAAMANRAFGFTESKGISFSDVKQDGWYADDVAIAGSAGYIAGYENGSFKPDNPINRQEAAVIIARILSLDTADLTRADIFTDAKIIPRWSKGAIGAVYAKGCMGGYQDQTFRPADPITRAEAIVALERAVEYAPKTAEAPEELEEPEPAASGIKGTVTFEGKGTKAVVQIFAAGGYEVLEEVETDDSGSFQSDLKAGSYDITAATETEVAYRGDVGVSDNKVTENDLELEEAAIVKGVLQDKNGWLVKGSRILFTTNPTFSAVTGNNGEFTVPVIPDRAYTVRAQEPDRDGEPGIVVDKLDIGPAGARNIGTLKAAFSAGSTGVSGGGGGGGGGGSSKVFAGGNGTARSPYQIATAAQLNRVRNYLDKNFVLTADIDLSGYENWEPIGVFQAVSEAEPETPVREKAFTGSFDGNGHTISNLTINQPAGVSVGLFGCAVGEEDKPGFIRDLTVENVDVTGYFLVGGVVAYQSWNCTVENVNLTGSNTVRGNFAVGGITGGGMSDLKNCHAEADIVVLGDFGSNAGVVAGGLEGLSMIDCTASGTVTAEVGNCFGLGGLAGGLQEGVAVKNCHADVAIAVAGENNVMVGGLFGYVGAFGEDPPTPVTGCSANAGITVSDGTSRVGGLVGGSFYHELYVSERPVPSSYAIRDCTTAGGVSGGFQVGSIAGYAYRSTVENCASTLTWTGHDEVEQIGYVENGENHAFAGGEGTKESPYQIATAAQLYQVRDYLDKNFILTADIDLSGYENWEPIGVFQAASEAEPETPALEKAFTGGFNGNGHTIANVTVNHPEIPMAVGLFGCVAGTPENPGSIYDLTVKNVDVTGYFLVGGVVGHQSWNCTLENVRLTGSNTIRGYQGEGGITGVNFGELRSCDAAADIVVLGDGGGCAGVLAGGLEGVSLFHCTATGTVTSEYDNCFGLGGLVGGAQKGVEISNCHAAAAITALGERNTMVGGLLGYTGTYGGDTPTRVTGCSADAAITVSDSTSRVGGLVGGSFYHEVEEPVPASYSITGCTTSGSITGGSQVGSIAGYAYRSTVENCTSTMTINGESGDVPQVGLAETDLGSAPINNSINGESGDAPREGLAETELESAPITMSINGESGDASREGLAETEPESVPVTSAINDESADVPRMELAEVDPEPVPITAMGAITGTAKTGAELTAGALTPKGATATYQWMISDLTDGEYSDIPGATSVTYTPVAADEGKFIRVVATGTGDYSGTATSAATEAVAAE